MGIHFYLHELVPVISISAIFLWFKGFNTFAINLKTSKNMVCIGNEITVIFSLFSPTFPQKANYFGSLLQASTVCLGSGLEGEVNVPFRDLLPMVHPNDIVFDGTDNCR